MRGAQRAALFIFGRAAQINDAVGRAPLSDNIAYVARRGRAPARPIQSAPRGHKHAYIIGQLRRPADCAPPCPPLRSALGGVGRRLAPPPRKKDDTTALIGAAPESTRNAPKNAPQKRAQKPSGESRTARAARSKTRRRRKENITINWGLLFFVFSLRAACEARQEARPARGG